MGTLPARAELVAAARAGDGEWAEAVMRTHILAARNAAGVVLSVA